jgi:hypothetical protein
VDTDTLFILLGIPAAGVIGALFGYRLGVIRSYEHPLEEIVRLVCQVIMELDEQKRKVLAGK